MSNPKKDYIGKMHNGVSYIIPIRKHNIITNSHIKLLNEFIKYEPKDDLNYFYIKKHILKKA